MYGGNSNWLIENWKKGLIVLVFVLASAAGIAVPMNAIDNTNEAQDVQIAAVQGQADTNTADIAVNTADIEALAKDVGDNLKLFTDYRDIYDQDIIDINADITVIDTWMCAFYNDSEKALGEWQVFMANWDTFYNKDTDIYGMYRGEFQSAIQLLWLEFAKLWTNPTWIGE